jgi:hypothetical protein
MYVSCCGIVGGVGGVVGGVGVAAGVEARLVVQTLGQPSDMGTGRLLWGRRRILNSIEDRSY